MSCIRIESLDQINCYKTELKQKRRKAVQNFYMNEACLRSYFDTSEILCEYVSEKYLNVFCKDEGFWRLYYYIVDFEEYDCGWKDGTVVCDVFSKQEEEEGDAVKKSLKDNGFSEYARYHKWSRKGIGSELKQERKSAVFVYDEVARDSGVEQLYKYFDKYTDYLPRRCEIDAFKKERKFINIYRDHEKREVIGSLVYTCDEKVLTAEFVYVNKGERGKGIASMLSRIYQDKFGDLGYKYVAWINDANEASIVYHRNLGYIRDKLYKATYKRG